MLGANGVYKLLAPKKKMREEKPSPPAVKFSGRRIYLAAKTDLPAPSLIWATHSLRIMSFTGAGSGT